jgi:hypothetical protein
LILLICAKVKLRNDRLNARVLFSETFRSIIMADYKETHEVTTNSGDNNSSATPWLAFLVGALLVAVVAIFFMNAQGTFDGPGGRAEINIKSPVTGEPRGEQPPPAKEPARPAQPEPAPAK